MSELFSSDRKVDKTEQERYEIYKTETEAQHRYFADQVRKEGQEYEDSINRYKVHLPQKQYEIINQAIISAGDTLENATDEAYRWATALKYADMYEMNVQDAYQNLDMLTEATFGKNYSTPKDAFTAVCDNWSIGVNTLKMGRLANQIREAERINDSELTKNLLEQYQFLKKDNENMSDHQSRKWWQEALKAGAQSAPFTGYVAAAGFIGSLFAPGVGTAAAFTASMDNAQGLVYMDLREDGASVQTASDVANTVGVLEAVVETGLGSIARFLGTSARLTGSAAKRAIGEKITEGLFNKLHLSGLLRGFARILTDRAKETFGEGLEEAVQEACEIAGRYTASALEGYEIEPFDLAKSAKQVAQAFKGGILGSLVLGFGNDFVGAVADVKDYLQVREAAKSIESEAVFNEATKDSRIFEKMSDEQRLKTQKNIFKNFASEREKRINEKASDIGEVLDAETGAETYKEDEEGKIVNKKEAYRTKEGKLYNETEILSEKDGVTKAQFIVGNAAEQTHYNRYGYIEYTDNGNTVVVDKMEFAPGRNNLKNEIYADFAEKFAGRTIEWNAHGQTAQNMKTELIRLNPRGKNFGLSYFAQSDVENGRARLKLAEKLQQYMPQLNDKERAAGIALLEARSAAIGMDISEYTKSFFEQNIFAQADDKRIQNEALQQGKAIAGGVAFRQFQGDVKAVIYASENGNFSTWVHENAHVFRRQLSGDLLTNAEKAFGVENGVWTEAQEEAFAQGFTDYLQKGIAPSQELKSLYQKMAEFLVNIYRSLKYAVKLTPDIEAVYNELLKNKEGSLAAAEKAVEQANRKREQNAKQKKEAQESSSNAKKNTDIYEQRIQKAQERIDNAVKDERATVQEKSDVLYDNAGEVFLFQDKQFLFENDDTETAEEYQADIDRYFDGTLKNHETLTLLKNTPVVLRALDLDNLRVTITKSQLDHIHTLHPAIGTDILKSLPEELSNPIAVFKSDSAHPNSKIIVTQHVVQGKPVVAIIELNKQESHYTVNSVRTVYEKNATEKDRVGNKKIVQDWINDGYLIYIDDKRASQWSATTGVSIPLGAFSTQSPSTDNILRKSDIVNEKNPDVLFQVLGTQGAIALDEAEEKTKRIDALAFAHEMEEMGKSAKDIRLATGWEKNRAGQWKYEIDDSKSSLKNEDKIHTYLLGLRKIDRGLQSAINGYVQAIRTKDFDIARRFYADKLLAEQQKRLVHGAINNDLTVDKVFDFPELYTAYPFIKDIPVRFFDSMTPFRAVLRDDGIALNTTYLTNTNAIKSTLLHEIQHVIQAAENSTGDLQTGKTEFLWNALSRRLKGAAEKAKYEYDEESLNGVLKEYRNSLSEIEARNVQKRVNMNAFQRRATLLSETEDVKRNTNILFQTQEKTLAGIHNITAKKLESALELGGLVNPSLAVIDTLKGEHNDFGDISLIAPSALIDKKSGKNAGTWRGDAYTPRFPQDALVMDIDEVGLEVLKDDIAQSIDDAKEADEVYIDIYNTYGDYPSGSKKGFLRLYEAQTGKIEIDDEFYAWKQAKEKAWGVEKKLFTEYTEDGGRVYKAYTLENISRLMKKDGREGSEGSAAETFHGFISVILQNMGSLKTIQDNKDYLATPKAVEEFDAKWKDIFYEISQACSLDDWYGSERLAEAVRSGAPVTYLKNEYGIELSEKHRTLLEQMIKAIKTEYPAKYFETKFERPVYLNEFVSAVIPQDTKRSLVDALKNAGLEIITYDENDEGARKEAVKKAAGEAVLFQEADGDTKGINDMLERQLIKEACEFSDWQTFMEFCEDGFLGELSIPTDAGAAWYQTIWEKAKGIYPSEQEDIDTIRQQIEKDKEKPGSPDTMDALFTATMSTEKGMLEGFLRRIQEIVKQEEWQPEDESDKSSIEELTLTKDKIFSQLRHGSWLSNALRVTAGKELTERQKQTLLTLIRRSARDYRALYADIMQDDYWKVALADSTAVKLGTALARPKGEFERLTPEQRTKLAKTIEDDEIAEEVRSGTLKMDEKIDSYIKSLKQKIKESEYKVKKLEKEYAEDFARITDWQVRELLRKKEQLEIKKARLENRGIRLTMKEKGGVELAKEYGMLYKTARRDYDTAFRQWKDLETVVTIDGTLQAKLDKVEALIALRENNRELKRRTAQLAAVRRVRTTLIKRTMRRVSFKNVDYEYARNIIAVQKLFEPAMLKGINKWINASKITLLEAWSAFKTDTVYREGLTKLLQRGGKNGRKRVLEMFEKARKEQNWNIDRWTKEERAFLSKYLPYENAARELELDKLSVEREDAVQLNIFKDNIPGGPLSEEGYKIISEAISPHIAARIQQKPFSDWTLVEMEELATHVDNLYSAGRKAFEAKQEARRQENDSIRDRIEQAIKNTGIHINATDSNEVARQKQKKINDILGMYEPLIGTAEYKKYQRQRRFRDKSYFDANIRRVARILDNYSDGINTDMLYYRENECFNQEHRNVQSRTERITKILKDNNITLDELFNQKISIGTSIESGKPVYFSVDELLFILAADKNDMSKEAVMYGNMIDSRKKEQYRRMDEEQKAKADYNPEKEALIGTVNYTLECQGIYETALGAAMYFVSQPENEKFRKLLEAIEDDYAKQFDRLNRASIEEFNQPVWREKSYVPIVRLESSGETNENKVREDLLGTSTDTMPRWVDKGMTVKRIKIAPLNQKPVELGLYKTWADAVERTEHFISYAPYVRDLNRIYKSRSASGLRQWIKSRYGKNMVDYINDYINEIANPNVQSAQSGFDRVVRAFRGKTAPAYLSWKISGVVKQAITSPVPYFQFVNPIEYATAAFRLAKDFNGMSAEIKQLSAFMNSRRFDPLVDVIQEQLEKSTNKVSHALSKFNTLGMQGLEWIDWACVAPGWYAVYKKELANLEAQNKTLYDKTVAELSAENEQKDVIDRTYLTSEQIKLQAEKAMMSTSEMIEKAVLKADDCTRLCQPSNRSVDLAPLFKMRGKNTEVVRALLQFQTSLNVIWQNIRYDIPNAVRHKNVRQITGMIAGYIVAGIALGAVCEGFDDDDDKKKKVQKLVYYSMTQFTDSVPVLGTTASAIAERLTTGKSRYYSNNLFPVVNEVFSGVKNISDAQWMKAAADFTEAAAYSAGLPVSGIKELGQVAGIGDGDGKADFYPQAFTGQRKTKKGKNK